jgi:MoxR-like ATPase
LSTGTERRGLAPEDFARSANRISTAVESVIRGKPDVIRLVLTVLLAGGHVLIEDVPGVGKTMLAKGLARSIDCSVSRIQFTPDLLPSDITGISAYVQETCGSARHPGQHCTWPAHAAPMPHSMDATM